LPLQRQERQPNQFLQVRPEEVLDLGLEKLWSRRHKSEWHELIVLQFEDGHGLWLAGWVLRRRTTLTAVRSDSFKARRSRLAHDLMKAQ